MRNKYHRKPITPKVSPQRPRDARNRPDPRPHLEPLGYDHPYPTMDEFANRLALKTDAPRTRGMENRLVWHVVKETGPNGRVETHRDDAMPAMGRRSTPPDPVTLAVRPATQKA